MQDAEVFPIRSFELISFQALMLPDGLEQFFRRRSLAVAQLVDRAALPPPGGVEVFSAGGHAAFICPTGGNVKPC